MPLIIQDYLFQFLALVTTLSEDFDFVLGLESLIQLESVYSLGQNILQMENRCIPLYPVKGRHTSTKKHKLVLKLQENYLEHFLQDLQ